MSTILITKNFIQQAIKQTTQNTDIRIQQSRKQVLSYKHRFVWQIDDLVEFLSKVWR